MKTKTLKITNYLLNAEKTMNIRFNRTGDNKIVISCEGYNHQDLNDVESALLKLGCRYDFTKGIQEFDRICGRTFTHLIEPIGGAK